MWKGDDLSTWVSKFFGSFSIRHIFVQNSLGDENIWKLTTGGLLGANSTAWTDKIYIWPCIFYEGEFTFWILRVQGGTSTTMTNNLIQDSKSTTKDDKSNIFLFWEFLWFLFNRFFFNIIYIIIIITLNTRTL